ncbi:MAG: glycosyltransferase family 9 protein [Candidatus Omnitrophica bacterium]|nr:glycosyltransferase family 9 protein [Candidatus Omnitrophota bacterium]MDD5487617.1 glycosyltransferase family 9 protein [Candidatus Omnitrophota bacterium]
MTDVESPKRIIIFELNWLGDILFSFPLLRALRLRFPTAYISCVVVPRYADLLANVPWINYVHVLSDDNRIFSVGEKLDFVDMVKKEKYGTAVFLKASRTKVIMSMLAGIPERVGFAGKNLPLTSEVACPNGAVHRADQLLSLAGLFGIDKADGTYEYFIRDDDKERMERILSGIGVGRNPFIVLNPGGNWDAKRWSPMNFISLARQILWAFRDLDIVITGAPGDRTLGDTIVSEAGGERVYNTAGRTSLNELAALFLSSELVVSADSGPLHLASATGATTIGLFGPTSPEITGQRGRGRNIVIRSSPDCAVPCYVKKCRNNNVCMYSIGVDTVFSAIRDALKNKDRIWTSPA